MSGIQWDPWNHRPQMEALERRLLLSGAMVGPVLVDVGPDANSHGAPAGTNVWAAYDQNIDPATATDRTFVVHGMQTGQLLDPPATVGAAGPTVTLSPSAGFRPGELVQATATAGILSAGGEAPDPFVWQFRAAAGAGSANFADSGQRLGPDGPYAWGTGGIALGKLNDDEYYDAFVAANSDPNRVWLNDGYGAFVDTGQELGHGHSEDVALGDLDGDGDLDAFVANHEDNELWEPNCVWLNDGHGTFTDTGQRLGEEWSRAVALEDLDGDGDLDAFVANGWYTDDGYGGHPNSVWLNDGHGHFVDSGQRLGNLDSTDVSLGDVDGDTDIDAFVVNSDPYYHSGQPDKLWLNDGNGRFTESPQVLGDGRSVAVTLEDLDGDLDLDAFVTGRGWGGGVWINDGHGHFSDTAQWLGGRYDLDAALSDLDGNGAPDAFVVGEEGNTVWLNDGAGRFQGSGQVLSDRIGNAVALATLDADGHVDAFVGNDGDVPDDVWLNDGNAQFSHSGQMIGYPARRAAALGDLDGDGHLDAFVPCNGGPDLVWLNDGQGEFDDSGQQIGNLQSGHVELGDLDSDGDLDAFVFGVPSCGVWLNDGQGEFQSSRQDIRTSTSARTRGDLGDLDGDGDLDAVMPGVSWTSFVWLNDGQGAFTGGGWGLGGWGARCMFLGDLDGDGDLDLFVGCDGPDRVALNDGTGSFTDGGQSLGDAETEGVALGDLDGDGDLDAFVADDDTPSRIWLNDGLGNFTDSGQELPGVEPEWVTLGDVDGDGDLDAFVATDFVYEGGIHLWVNDGSGRFAAGGRTRGSLPADADHAELGDLDGDGDLDAFLALGDHPSQVWLNEEAAPAVVDVRVRGDGWSPSFLEYLADEDFGIGGYTVPVGSAKQMDPLPWVNVDRIDVAFSEDVDVAAGDLSIYGAHQALYVPSGFVYDRLTLTATWDLAAPVGADKLLLVLSAGVADAVGNALDGEWTNAVSTYPSGDGSAGGDFEFRLNVLPGDMNQDGQVDVAEYLTLKRNFGTTAPAAWGRGDLDGDLDVDYDDYAATRDSFGTSLPAGEPTVPPAVPLGQSGDSALAAAATEDRVALPPGCASGPTPQGSVAEPERLAAALQLAQAGRRRPPLDRLAEPRPRRRRIVGIAPADIKGVQAPWPDLNVDVLRAIRPMELDPLMR